MSALDGALSDAIIGGPYEGALAGSGCAGAWQGPHRPRRGHASNVFQTPRVYKHTAPPRRRRGSRAGLPQASRREAEGAMIRSVLIYGSSGIVLFEKEWLPVMEKVWGRSARATLPAPHVSSQKSTQLFGGLLTSVQELSRQSVGMTVSYIECATGATRFRPPCRSIYSSTPSRHHYGP